MPKRSGSGPRGDQRWRTFIQNHAPAIIACDFCVAVTATFRLFYVLVVIEHGLRRLLHCNVTEYPTAEWTLQQLREAIPCEHLYRFLIHDNDNIFSDELDKSIGNLGIKVIETPYRSPQANSICERTIGSMRREFLDYVIPLNETHLRKLIKDWKLYYNRGRPHSSLGPGVPDPPTSIPAPLQSERHGISDLRRLIATPVLGGLHHDYALA
jgi:transposase InsO family protein